MELQSSEEYQEVLVNFRRRQYARARPGFESFLSDDLVPKDQAMLRVRIVNCLFGELGDEVRTCQSGSGHPEQWNLAREHVNAYLPLLRTEDARGWYIGETRALFRELTAMAAAYERELLAYLKEVAAATAERFRPALLEALMSSFDQEATNFARPGHVVLALELGRAYLDLSRDGAEPMENRVAVRNRMAETLFFGQKGAGEQSALRAISLLDRSLEEVPDNHFATRLRQHIAAREATMLQIHRFQHDTGSRIGSIKSALDHLTRLDLPAAARHDLDVIRANLGAVDAVNDLVQEKRPAVYEEVDPARICRRVLRERGLSEQGVVVVGEPVSWEVCAGYLILALDNLLRNSIEAYTRRGNARPEVPVTLTVHYGREQIEVADQAGGIDPDLQDIFLPYVSEKEIKQSTGLGLSQARRAIVLQDGELVLAADQPADGARFVIKLPGCGEGEER